MNAAAPIPGTSRATERRVYYQRLLIMALSDAHPDDADQIIAAWLSGATTGGPIHNAVGSIKEDATWWAETAPQIEVQAHAFAAMQSLGNRALGRTTRLRLMAALWQGLATDDRAAFLARATR